jgi:hypothetical protein
MSKRGWMVTLAALAVGCASTSGDADDTTSEGALASDLHSIEEAQKVAETFFARAEGMESGDYDSLITPELLRAERAYDATDPAPGPSILRCDQDSPVAFTVGRGVRIGNDAAFTIRYTFDYAQTDFAFRDVTVRLTDLKVSFSHCGGLIGDEFRVGQGGPCVKGGKYCGGDKVSGGKNVLYRCAGGSSGSELEYCTNGCEQRPGDDDRCKP